MSEINIENVKETVSEPMGIMGEITGGDPAQMLKADHKKVKELFSKFEEVEDEETQKNIASQILLELNVHAALEEEIVYPALRKEMSDGDMLDEAWEEHHVVHFLVGELETMSPGAKRYKAKMTVLKESVEHHIKEEEGQMLNHLKDIDNKEELAEQMMERKQELLEEFQNKKIKKPSVRKSAARSGRSAKKASSARGTSKRKPTGSKRSAAGKKGATAKKSTSTKKSTTRKASSTRKSSKKSTSGRKSTKKAATGKKGGSSRTRTASKKTSKRGTKRSK